MAVKQNGVLATFTPTTSKYTNQEVAAPGTISATAWNMYTCPLSTLMSGKLIVSNNTGGALNIDVGIVEQTDIIQLDALASQPGTPSNYGAFSFPSGTSSNYTTSVVLDYTNLSGTFVLGEVISWTNSTYGGAQTAILHYHDTSNGRLWLRNMSHPLGLNSPSGDTTFTGAGGATCQAGSSFAGTGGTAGWSGNLRFYDSLNGTLYLQSREFRNNIDYAYLYANDNNENRERSNNNLNRSLGRVWRPVASTQTRYAAAGNTTPATEFISGNGIEVLVSSVSQCSAEQFIVQDKSVADNDIFELNGIVLGSYQSLYVKSTGALTFTLVGFEEVAQSLS